MIGTKTTKRYVIAAPSAAPERHVERMQREQHGRRRTCRRSPGAAGISAKNDASTTTSDAPSSDTSSSSDCATSQKIDRLQHPDPAREQRQLDAVEAQQQPERAQEDPHPVGEALEAPGDPQPQVDAHRRQRDHDDAGRDVRRRAAGGRPATSSAVSSANSRISVPASSMRSVSTVPSIVRRRAPLRSASMKMRISSPPRAGSTLLAM